MAVKSTAISPTATATASVTKCYYKLLQVTVLQGTLVRCRGVHHHHLLQGRTNRLEGLVGLKRLQD